MENKKKFILVLLILFIFLGLTIFTFANPSGDELQGSGSGNNVTDNGNKNDNKEQEKDNTENEKTDTVTTGNNQPSKKPAATPAGSTGNSDKKEDKLETVVDNSYELAKAAVEKAAKELDEDSYEKAKELVEKVTDPSKKEELENALGEVKNNMDVRALVEALAKQTNEAKNKGELDNARKFREDKKVDEAVKGVTNEDLQKALESILEELAKVLDDNTNPDVTVTGANYYEDEDIYYGENVSVSATDANGVTITIVDENGEKVNGTDLSGLTDGTYTVTVVDGAFNEITVTIVVDTVSPVITLKKYTKDNSGKVIEADGYYDFSVAAHVEDANLDTFTVDEKDYVAGSEIKERTEHIVVATDKAGHRTEVRFTIDKDYPLVYLNGNKFEKAKNPVQYYDGEVKIEVKDTNLATVVLTKDGIEMTYTEGMTLTEEGTYKIVATDKAGLKTEVNFVIDTTAPIITLKKFGRSDVLEPNGYYTFSVAAYVEDANLDTFTVDGKDYVAGSEIKERTEHIVVATDKAGHRTEVRFTIDKDHPIISLNGKKNQFNNSSKDNEKVAALQYFNKDVEVKVTDKNLATVVLTKDGIEMTYTEGMTLTEEGTYKIVATDKAGLKTEVNFVIKKTLPVITLKKYTKDNKGTVIEPNGYYAYSVAAFAEDKYLDTFTVDGKDYVAGSEIWERTEHIVVATDKAGNRTEVKFTIDKDYPLVYLNNNKFEKADNATQYFNKDVEVKVTDKNLATVVLTKDGIEMTYTEGMTLTEEGTYKVEALDKANNKTVVEFVIDTTAPYVVKVQVWNGKDSSSNYITNGELVIVHATFSEKLKNNPTLTIGSQTVEFKLSNDGKGNDLYVGKITIPVDETLLEDGPLAFTISEYKDLAGMTGEKVTETNKEVTKNLIYDKTAPTAIIGGTTGYKYWKNSYEFEVVITEKNLDSVYYAWNQSNNTTNRDKVLNSASAIKVADEDIIDNGDGTYTIKIQANLEGRHVFNLKVVDKAGNELRTSKGWYQIDDTAPSILVNGTVYGPEHTEIIYISADRFTGYGIDELSGIKTSLVNNADRPTFNQNWAGKYTVVLTDNAGNTSTFIVILDKDIPVINGAENGEYYNVPVTLTVEEKNIDTVVLTKDGKVVEGYELGTTLYEDGEYTLIVTDKVGNSAEVTFTIDTTDPTASIGGTTGEKYWKNSYEFEVVITEKNLDSVYYAWNQSNNTTNRDKVLNSASAIRVADEDIIDNGDGTYTIKIQANLEGRHVFNLKVVDKAGNELRTSKGWYQIDNINPTGSISYSENSKEEWTNHDVVVTLTTEEPVKIIAEGTWNVINPDKYGYATTFTKAINRNMTQTVIFEDRAGNIGTQEFVVSNVDKIAPSILVNGTVYGPDYTETIYITAERFTGYGIDEVSGIKSSIVNNASRDKFNQNWAGTYRIILTDNAGNVAKYTVILTHPSDNLTDNVDDMINENEIKLFDTSIVEDTKVGINDPMEEESFELLIPEVNEENNNEVLDLALDMVSNNYAGFDFVGDLNNNINLFIEEPITISI